MLATKARAWRARTESLRLHSRLGWVARFAPGFHAAVQRHRAREAHFAQRGGGERRDEAELAVCQNPAGGVGQLLIDAQFELPARQQTRPRNVTGAVGVALANVEHDQIVFAALDTRL